MDADSITCLMEALMLADQYNRLANIEFCRLAKLDEMAVTAQDRVFPCCAIKRIKWARKRVHERAKEFHLKNMAVLDYLMDRIHLKGVLFSEYIKPQPKQPTNRFRRIPSRGRTFRV
jgi:hypothetical protein